MCKLNFFFRSHFFYLLLCAKNRYVDPPVEVDSIFMEETHVCAFLLHKLKRFLASPSMCSKYI